MIYQDAVNMIKTCSMDPEVEKKYTDLLGDMKELHTTVQNLKEVVMHHDPRVARMIETTKTMITRHFEDISHLFIKTHALNRAKELINSNRYIVIKGNPGTGKTTIAKILMKELMEEGKSPLQLYEFTDLYKTISTTDSIVGFIDNIFGEFYLSSNAVQEFKATADMVKVLIESDHSSKSNILLFTIRNDIYQDYVSKGNDDIFLQSSMVDLSDKIYALQEEEVIQFINKYDLCKNMRKTDIISKVSEMPISIGFPQCCKFAKKAQIESDISAFLRSPATFLRDYLTKLIDNPTPEVAVLVYILLSGGEVELELITNAHLDLPMKRVSLEFIGLPIPCINKMQSSINCFDGFLTNRDIIRNTITFAHSSVHESLFKVLFYFDPKSMIKHCHHPLLLLLTTRENSNSTQVIIGHDLFYDVALRVEKIIEEKSVAGYTSISLLELWNDYNFHQFMLGMQVCMLRFKTCHDIHGASVMVHFSKAGNARWVSYLLPSSDERQRYRSLNAACSNNQADIVQLFLNSGVKYDLKTCFYSVQSGNLDILFQVCASVDLQQISSSLHPLWKNIKHSLLQEICLMRQTHFVEKILQKYPFLLDIKDSQGANVLHSVASSGDKCTFNLLVKFGCDPYEKDRDNGHTVLTCACQDGRTDMVKYLIEKYPALLQEHTDVLGKSLLYWAAFSGRIDMIEYMLNLFEYENILNISSDNIPKGDKADNSGRSILHAACKNGYYDMCKYLLCRYPQLLNVRDNNGANVFHYTALGGNIALLKYLLSKGFDVNDTTNTGMTVLKICCAFGREKMCKYLVNMYPGLKSVRDNKGCTVFHSACKGGSVEMISFFIEKGMDINALSNDGRSILHTACFNRKFEVCEYLVENYPDVLNVRNKIYNTVLHDAAWGGNVQIVKLLIEKKMDIIAQREDGETILHLCCCSGEIDMCEYLVNNFYELVEIRDNRGWTALHAACSGGSVDAVSFLIKKG
ncbi:uncharacterized protein LOC134233669 [Saccostrea cucullata]|uniref:uncharacterized protein LOC134233669 n=1 Tax=Saccostrea cuccullata TaxID=36930 RepID=UPI002ECFFDFE